MEEVTRESQRMKVPSESENDESEDVLETGRVNDTCTLTSRDDETKTTRSTDAGASSSLRFILQNLLELSLIANTV